MRPLLLSLTLPLLLAAAPQMTTTPAPCPTPAAPLPAGLAAWKVGASLTAATTPRSLTSASLPLGTRVEGILAPSPLVRLIAAPEKMPAPGTLAGMFAITVTTAGIHRVALDEGAWIDLLRDGRAVAATAHAHGPACSGIRKIVDFELKPGRYVLQISGSKAALVSVLVTRLP